MQPAPTVNPIIGGGGLSSTASDYIRFVRMILNDGELDGVRVLKADTVEAMSRNQIGAIGVPALKTALPERSDDFSFVADGRDKWGLGFLITADQVAGKRSAGSLSWGGIYNTYFWIDRTRGIAGVILTQFLPFADRKALACTTPSSAACTNSPTPRGKRHLPGPAAGRDPESSCVGEPDRHIAFCGDLTSA